jgi:hypothetical protein
MRQFGHSSSSRRFCFVSQLFSVLMLINLEDGFNLRQQKLTNSKIIVIRKVTFAQYLIQDLRKYFVSVCGGFCQ